MKLRSILNLMEAAMVALFVCSCVIPQPSPYVGYHYDPNAQQREDLLVKIDDQRKLLEGAASNYKYYILNGREEVALGEEDQQLLIDVRERYENARRSFYALGDKVQYASTQQQGMDTDTILQQSKTEFDREVESFRNFGAQKGLNGGRDHHLVGIGLEILRQLMKLDLYPSPYLQPGQAAPAPQPVISRNDFLRRFTMQPFDYIQPHAPTSGT